MRRGRPLPELTLTAEENNRLVEWTRRRKTSQALAMRARIVLACGQGSTNTEVAARLRVTKQMVGAASGETVSSNVAWMVFSTSLALARRVASEMTSWKR
jgi:hypothetical protein